MENELYRESIFTNNMLSFIFENAEPVKVYTHYTHQESIAHLIMDEGFKYTESFYKTTQNIQNDLIVLNYKHNLYEHYGEFMIIICIPDELIDFVKKTINLSKLNLSIEDYICEKQLSQEETYILPPLFVKGYIKYKTGEIIHNPKFRLNYIFNEYIKKLK